MPDKIDVVDYLPTEREINQVLERSDWRKLLARDYSANKGNLGRTVTATDTNTEEIFQIKIRLDTVEGQVASLEIRVTTAEAAIVDIDARLVIAEDTLATHIAASEAHGASGNIVGDLDFATEIVGGVVFKAGNIPYVPAVTITPPAVVGAAPAAYNQAYAQQQTDAINALIANIGTAQTGFNQSKVSFDDLVDAMIAARQMAT